MEKGACLGAGVLPAKEEGEMIRQIRYFQAVVRNNSFSEAAEECHISQSAISQQVRALERELGFSLLERRNRKFSLTPAGEHFYRKSLVWVADFERMCQEARQLSKKNQASLVIGYLRCYSGQEFHLALEEFSARYPDVSVKIEYGNHEELYELLRTGSVDLVLLEEARLLVIGGQGFMPVEGAKQAGSLGMSIIRIPLFRGEKQITRNYCAFWKKDNSGYYIEEFAALLKQKFE